MGNPRRQFVRNDTDKREGRAFPLLKAFKCAGSGFLQVFVTQRNMKIHVVFALVAVILGFVLSIPLSSWLAIIICIGLVFVAECLNTALESVVDLVSPEYHPLAKRAKDCAAAGVLVTAFLALIVGTIVYVSAAVSIFSPSLLF